jgi:hypothetical protein
MLPVVTGTRGLLAMMPQARRKNGGTLICVASETGLAARAVLRWMRLRLASELGRKTRAGGIIGGKRHRSSSTGLCPG